MRSVGEGGSRHSWAEAEVDAAGSVCLTHLAAINSICLGWCRKLRLMKLVWNDGSHPSHLHLHLQ